MVWKSIKILNKNQLINPLTKEALKQLCSDYIALIYNHIAKPNDTCRKHKINCIMNEELKIDPRSWTDLDFGDVDTMSTTAAGVISNADDYPLMATEATLLTQLSNDYHIIFSRYSQFGGTDVREQLENTKDLLYKGHETVAAKLEATANGNREYLTRPGYRLMDDKSNTPSRAVVPPPRKQKIESSGVRGRVKFILKAAKSTEIKAIIGRYSDDDGLTWVEGQIIEFTMKFTLEGQPSGKTRLYQFMFKATSGRVSDWSDKFRVEVF